MFIRFESDGLKEPQQRTVECANYQVSRGDGRVRVSLDDDSPYELIDSNDCWQRAYVMNSEGRTIETIHAPLAPPQE